MGTIEREVDMAVAVQDMLRRIPKVDRVLEWPEIAALLKAYPRPEVLAAVRNTLGDLRSQVRTGHSDVLPGSRRYGCPDHV